MTATKAISSNRRLCSALLVGTFLGSAPLPAFAQEAAAPAPTPPVATGEAPVLVTPPPFAQPAGGVIRSVNVSGNQRLERETVLSYTSLRPGEPYTRERLDEALRDLFATELFADVRIRDDQGALTIEVRENPVVNRIILEGNRRLKADKISPEIRLAPRQIFTRTKARADVARIIELYRRQGRFAATVEPQIVELDQNRVDVVFEINEGPLSKVRQINVLGNEAFSDGQLRGEMATEQARLFNFFSSNDTYDPDRLAFDQQKLRQFYLTKGYADFRVVSAIAELTPDRRDFIITYVVEEGERYKFGDVAVASNIRDFNEETLTRQLPMKTGDWYDAKEVEDTVNNLTETAGIFGYAFAQVQPQFERNAETRTMDVVFQIQEAPRVYVERIDINGNVNTRDKVIRREFRLAEGDPFNSLRVKRSRDRIQSLGFFQDDLEIQQLPGSTPDRVVLAVDVEEKATGELQLSAGFSSLERFLVNLSIRQRNFMGKGQELRAGINYSTYSKSIELGFTEPYVFDRNIAAGFDIYRRDLSNFNFVNNERNTTYEQVQTGGQLRAGVPLNEYLSLALRYQLSLDEITLDRDIFFSDPDGGGPLPLACDPLIAGRYLCDAIGDRITSSVGYSLLYDTLDNRLRPTRGERAVLSQDFAGLGGETKYLRTRANAAKYWPLGDSGFIFSTSLEGGYITSFEDSRGPGIDKVRLTDRFFIGEGQLRGFDIRGIGPRVIRRRIDANGMIVPGKDGIIADDSLGGRAYYIGRAELEIPLGATGRELGLRPSIFVDVGALFDITRPLPTAVFPDANNDGVPEDLVTPILTPEGLRQCVLPNNTLETIPNVPGLNCATGSTLLARTITAFDEQFLGDTPSPRVSVGFGINWISPFGPFRIDIARAILKEPGDDTKFFTFGIGTSF